MPGAAPNHEDFPVALVSMPFCSAIRPSIQLGLLSALTRKAGFPADAYHLHLHLAAQLTPEIYEPLCGTRGRMTGEWLFSVAAFKAVADDDDEAYFRAFPDEVARAEKFAKNAAFLSLLRREILPAYVEEWFNAVDWGHYRVVGFSSLFQQNVASLALARRIKERWPQVSIVFGGANMEGEMGEENLRAFPFLDFVVIGEGDLAFPALLHRLAIGESVAGLQGVAFRNGSLVVTQGQASPVRDLDALPVPDYSDYFDRLRKVGLHQNSQYSWCLPFESSRGCWWGQKHHCTFCGLNGQGMVFRAKSPAKVIGELNELARRYRISFFEATDNILDMKYVHALFGEIERTKTDYSFFYEIKANLSREQIRSLYLGGVRWVQPGIESLSTHVLQLMRKGCTMLQNLLLLKWCRYYRIRVSWNLIWGFPGETAEDFGRELQVLKLLTHLEPPGGCGRIWMERFSPYFSEHDRFPVHALKPEASYSYVYPGHVALDKIAYFFDYAMDDTLPEEAHQQTRRVVQEWREWWCERPQHSLTYRRIHDSLFVDDERGPGRCGSHAFHGPLAAAYELCSDAIRSVPEVVRHLESAYSCDEVQGALEEFCRLGLMVGENGRYLSLALPVNPNW